MKKPVIITSFGLATLFSLAVLTSSAYAWHPQGTIQKEVQDQTTDSAIMDANDSSTALTVNTGDTLVYTITVSNTGAIASNGDNDMVDTIVTDTLPAGLQLVGSAPNTNLGTIKPGQKTTIQYTAKVTDATDGDIITNQACFTGNSSAGDAPQNGCDTAVVKVHVPPAAPAPSAPAPTPPPAPAALPNTGSSVFSAGIFVSSAAILVYALNTLRLKLRGDA
ncbi:MAG TPA: hypothetical protein VMB52_00960 [Verrucomicrobiae bacterium]|nr:hypothetical protein [Verrucomicrobiae bacterium]